jgi:hypothetical protein
MDVYKKLRRSLNSGKSMSETIMKLKISGIPQHKINWAISEYDKDENTDYDDKLIAHIEARIRRGEDMMAVLDHLIQKGHKPIEVRKAVFRARMPSGMSVKDLFRLWEAYTWAQIIVLGACFVLGFLSSPWYFVGALTLGGEMLATAAGFHKREKGLRTEMSYVPGTFGPSLNMGYFGYNPFMRRVHFRWWILPPALIVAIVFFGMGIGFLVFGKVIDTMITIAFAIIAAISFLSIPKRK